MANQSDALNRSKASFFAPARALCGTVRTKKGSSQPQLRSFARAFALAFAMGQLQKIYPTPSHLGPH
jgi:hypothetical protein